MCDRRIHIDRARRSVSSRQCAYPFYSSHAGFFFFWQSITSPRSVSTPTAQICFPATSGFSQSYNRRWKGGDRECDGHTVHKLSQRRLTADWLAPRESDCSWMHSKVSSDWLTIFIKTTRPVLEIFKMAGYFSDSPRTSEVWEKAWTEVSLLQPGKVSI